MHFNKNLSQAGFFLVRKVCEVLVVCAETLPSRRVWLAHAPTLRHGQPSRERGQFGCGVMQKDKYWMRVSPYKLFVGCVVALVCVSPGT